MKKLILTAAALIILINTLWAEDSEVYYYEGKVKIKLRLAEDVLAVEDDEQKNGVTFLEAKDKNVKSKLEKKGAKVYPALYKGSKTNFYTLTDKIIVKYHDNCNESAKANIEKEYGLKLVRRLNQLENAYLYETGNALRALETANSIYEAGLAEYSYPDLIKPRIKRSANVRATPDDPLFLEQWHLLNTGQDGGLKGEDIDVVSVWDTYKGSSEEIIAVVDDGLDIKHEDLKDNVLTSLSYDFVGKDKDPTPTSTQDDHGTSVAGVAAGRGFNSIGISGAAPNAKIAGYRLVGANTDTNEAEALSKNSDTIDIYTNSWGPDDDGMGLEGPGPLTLAAIENGVKTGRGGLGTIYVWAGGNGGGNTPDNSNYDGYANLRYTIAVGASTNKGQKAYYTEDGSNILVSAPSSGGSADITTTALTNGNPDTYTYSFGGTSAAAPVVAGVAALMLHANPNLRWRDVQHILIETADKIDPDSPNWKTNGAGYSINYYLGFGRVNAKAAVAAAETWTNIPAETVVSAKSSPYLSIPDGASTGVSNPITINDNVKIDFVEVYFTAKDHACWSDLAVKLTSPSGTESILSESHYTDCMSAYDNWRFGAVRNYGESSKGTWTLSVTDPYKNYTGTFQEWEIKIYGEEIDTPTPPAPMIKANDQTSELTLRFGDMLNLQVSLSANSLNAVDAQWWLFVEAPEGYGSYYYNTAASGFPWVYGLDASYTGTLFDLPLVDVLNLDTSLIPSGTYTFTFAIDTNLESPLNSDSSYADTVVVTVQ
ncbi:proprotein convertase subtilisin/kexin type 5 [Candidatus Magnetoovum chiemensis]|nr:proprotein convertase subtilisin/kexin type 5 [Candidatus Magnetoovum chiemensis]